MEVPPLKKYVLIVFFITFLLSCKNNEIVQNKDNNYLEIEKELKVWNLEKSEILLENLDLPGQEKYRKIINEKREKLKKLYLLEEAFKNTFYSGDFRLLDPHMNLNSVDNFKYKQLKSYEISDIRTYIGNREFLDDYLNETAVMNFYEENMYVELNLQYEGNDWFIKSFSEKR